MVARSSLIADFFNSIDPTRTLAAPANALTMSFKPTYFF
jgi:hypothetical protein